MADEIRANGGSPGDAFVEAVAQRTVELLRPLLAELQPNPVQPQKWYSREQAAKRGGVTAATIRELARSGRLKEYRRSGRRPVYDVDDLDALFRGES